MKRASSAAFVSFASCVIALAARGQTLITDATGRSIDIGSTSATYATLAERIEQQTGIPYLLFDGTLADTPRLLREVGYAIGALDAGEMLARDAESQLREIAEPFGWFDVPPSLNRLLGVQWLARILHPKLFPEPLGPRIKAFHRLYYHREPTDSQVRALLEIAGVSQ
ncbi:MAG TPA: hypothetical protein VEO36_02185 [Casimicrobiaceae bacterium]|nr:hypothetical protein [Casimicrobiaceae bacterium]